MPPNNDLQAQITQLTKDLKALTEEVYRNNFSATQDFNKASNFTSKLKVPHYDSIPPVGQTGEVIEVNGKLYICSATNVYTIVGTQT